MADGNDSGVGPSSSPGPTPTPPPNGGSSSSNGPTPGSPSPAGQPTGPRSWLPKNLPPTEQALERFEAMVGNVLMARREMLTRLLDPRRSIYDECGYPAATSTINPEIYQQQYDRNPIAARVVQVMPRESWQVQPTVYEDEDILTTTPFEARWALLPRMLRGERSYYQDEFGSPVWEVLSRADALSGIGQFGLILVGIDDGLPLNEPANGVDTGDVVGSPTGVEQQYYDYLGTVAAGGQLNPKQKQGTAARRRVPRPPERELLFLRCFPESLVQITQYESNIHNPRFGHPVMYLVTFNDPRSQATGVGLPLASLQVHWTRVVHLADNLGSSEIFGVPRMRPVVNRLLDLDKLYGGSAEMYWRGAFPGLSLETQAQLGPEVEIDQAGVRNMMEQYMNGLQRYLALTGMTARSLAPQVVDPSGQIACQIEAICIQLGIPKRVFMGSERGELASGMDDAAWNDRLRDRQHMYITPRVIVPFVDRLISMGVLPEPKGYSVYWPDLTSQSNSEKATVAVQRTQALVQYVQSALPQFFPPLDFLTRVLGLHENEAAAVLRNAGITNRWPLIPPGQTSTEPPPEPPPEPEAE